MPFVLCQTYLTDTLLDANFAVQRYSLSALPLGGIHTVSFLAQPPLLSSYNMSRSTRSKNKPRATPFKPGDSGLQKLHGQSQMDDILPWLQYGEKLRQQ